MNWAERRNIYEGKSGQKAGSGAALSSGDRWAERRKKYNSGDIITPEQRQAQAQSLRRVQAQRRGQAQQYKAQETEHDKQQAEYNRLMGLDLEEAGRLRTSAKANLDMLKNAKTKIGEELNTQTKGVKYSGRDNKKITELQNKIKSLDEQIAAAQKNYDDRTYDYQYGNLYQKQAKQDSQIKEHGNYKADIDESENDAYYRAINGLVRAGSKAELASNRATGNVVSANSGSIIPQMTEEERNTYNYIFDTEGSEAAKDYLNVLEYNLASRYKEQRTKDAQDMANSGFGGAAAGTAMSIAEGAVSDTGGALSFYGEKFLRDIGVIDNNLPINYQKTFASSTWSNALQEQVTQNIDSPVGRFLYGTGVSIADNVVRNIILAPLGSGAILGTMAVRVAGEEVNNALSMGATENEAALYGALSGIGEVIGEKVPLEKLLKIKSPKTVKEFVKTLLGQAFTEGMGEAVTTVWNDLVSANAIGELSDYNMAKAEYIRQGMSEEEAEKQATKDAWNQILLDALGGAISGVVMGGGAMGLSALFSRANGKKTESNVISSVVSDIDESEVQKRAAKYEKKGMSTEEAAQKAREDIQNEKAKKYTAQGMSAEEAASAVETDDIAVKSDNERLRGEILARGLKAEEGSEANIAAKAIQEKLKSGESVSAEEWKGFIKSTREQVSLSETKNAIKEAARKSGESVADTDIDVMAAAMEKNFMGRNMTEAENKLIKGSEAAKKAYSELTGLDYETGEVIPEIVRKKEQANKQSVEAKIKNGLGKEITNYAGEDSSQGYKNTLSKTYKAYLSIVEHANAEDITQARAKIGAKDYAGYFEAFYEGGRSGEYTLETLKGLVKNDSAAAEALSVAYELGRSEGKSQGKKNAKARQAKLDEKIRAGKEKKAAAPKGVARSITKEELKTGAAKNAGAKSIDMKRHFSQKQRYSIAVMREFAKMTDINIVFYQTEDGKGANGWYDRETDTIYIDLFSGFNNEQAMLRTLSHELTHFMEKYSPEHYEEYKQFLLDYYYGKDNGETLSRLIEQEKRLAPNRSAEYWQNEVVANASEMFINDESAMRALIGEHAGAAQTIDEWFKKMNYALRRAFKGIVTSGTAEADAAKELKANVETFSEAQRQWSALLKESVEAKKAAGTAEESGEAKFSMRQNITGDSGKVYGDGVYLDSNLLDGLSDKERAQMVKARIAELGGQTFTAYDGNTPIEIKIENSRKRFKNKSGRIVSVNKDLTTKNIDKGIKQEAVVLSDELIYASNYKENAPAHHSHGWLDNNGKNDWEKRTVIIQEKNNSVWEATLHIANAQNGEKILYDIDPIKKVERSGKSDTTSTTDSIRQGGENVNTQFSMRVDSEGRELSEAQQEYFEYSEVRNKEGLLIPVYHATDNSFTIFDRKKLGAETDKNADDVAFAATAHIGFWFNSNDIKGKTAQNKSLAGYLNIEDPYYVDSIGALAAQIMDNYGEEYGELQERFDGRDYEAAEELGDSFVEWLERKGYDGIIVEDEEFGGTSYVALKSNQFKNADNQNPTENPDIRYSMRGRNADGIEVYETSDEIKSLPKKDKQKVFLDIMTNQYRGRTARFIRNGHAYYATFDTADVEKNIYGDKKSDRKGWKAKINTGADGDIFELVENSTYNGSKPEKGKLIASHDGVLYWDYFIKTVQIDNVVYDLVANIRKKKDNSFVYGIQIRENKKIKASPPGGSLLRALNRVPNALQEQYTQNEAKSQQIFEKNNEKSAIGDLGKIQYQLRIEDKNRLDILDKQETRLTADIKTLEKAYAEAIRAEYERNIKPSEETSRRAAEINRKAAKRYMNEVGATFHVPKDERSLYLLPIINEIIDQGPAISESEGLIEQLYRTAYKHSAEYAVEGSENEKNLREYIRKTAIYVDPGTKGDVGDYEQFRKNNTGSLKLTGDTNALSLDEFYAEVKNAAPDIFSDTTDGAEQLYELSAFMKDRGRVESIGDYMNEDESVKWAMDGDSSLDTELENLFDKTVGSFLYEASRKERERTNAARINRAMDNVRSAVSNYGRAQEYARAEGVLAGQMHQGAKDAAKLRTVTENYENRIKAYRNKLHEVREKRDAVLEARKEAFKNYRAERADSLNRSVLRKRIIKDARTLNTMLLNPTDNKHIPQELRGAVAGLLGNFTDNTSVFSRDKLERLKGAYSEIAKEDNDLNDLYDPDIAEYISKLEKRAEMENVVDGRRLSELSADELFYVQAVTEYFTHVVRDGNALFIDGRRQNISEIAAETISAAKKHGLKTYRGGALGEAANWADKYLNYDNITPVYFFNRMGGGMKRLFNDMLYNSQLKYAQDINEDQKFMAAIYEKYHVWGWTSANPKNKNDRLKFVTERREVLDMARNEVLTAYVTYKRGKANGDGAIHMMEGGIVVKSKTSDNFFKKFRKSSKGIQLTYRDLRTMFGFLTAEQKACADAIVNYLTAVEGARRNETSMALYGYKKFNETYYFPYRVASDYVKSYAGQEVGPDGTKQVGASRMLKNMGSSKALNPNANAAIVIDDFFKIVAESMNDTARYHAFAVQQDNFMRVLNYKGTVDAEHGSTSVKQAIRDSFGAEGINYITGLMGDSFGGAVQLNNDNVFGKLFGKFKKTAVAANLSVAIQQPSAIVRATALIDGKYLLKTVKQKNVLDELYDYSSTAFLKNMGRFDIGTGRSAEQYILKPELKSKEYLKQLFATGEYDTGELDDLTGFLSEKADWVTWGHIMNAVMAEIEDTTDLERGTEEFKRAAGRRFDEIVNATQVYDSILTKSPMMRSQNSLTQIVAAFKMEPTLSYNVFMDSIGERKTIPSASRGLVSLAMTTFANALLKSLIGAMRDRDKDKTYLEKYAEKLVSNIWSDLIPILNLPGVGAISEAVQGFTTELPEMGMISDTVSAVNKAIKKIGNGDWGGALGDLTVALNLFGLPVRNIYRDISAIFNTAFDTKPLGDTSLKGVLDAALEGLEGESIVYGAGKALGLIDTSKTAGIKRAMKKGSYTEIRKATNKLIEEYIAEGKSKSDAKGYIKTALTNYWKPKYRNANEKERAKIRRALFDTGIYENTDAVVKMCNNWLKDD